ncbi:MAG: hypothetical protein J1F71_05320 [Clostridiales bacterium]|nr:hypothetical protein [Clostridiales bacterium]
MLFKLRNGCAIMMENLQKVITLAELDLNNENSEWTKEELEDIVLKEMYELRDHFINGEKFFKYGKRQRRLVSTYHISDTLRPLGSTELGKAILALQDIYNRI